jgi:hypothetical protein
MDSILKKGILDTDKDGLTRIKKNNLFRLRRGRTHSKQEAACILPGGALAARRFELICVYP